MATWAEFEIAEPDLAAFARERMEGPIVYACSIEEAVGTEYSEDEMPLYRRWEPPSAGP